MQTLREWRVARLLTVRGLAEAAKVTTRTITETEHDRSVPTFSTIKRLCEALQVEPTEVAEFKAALDKASKAKGEQA